MRRILEIASFVLLLQLATLPAWAREIDLATAWTRSDVVVVAQVADPLNEVLFLPTGRHVQPFHRLIRLFSTVETLRGKAPARLRVDEAGWRAQWQALRACAGRKTCPMPEQDQYRGTLAREPVPGNRVLLFLKRTRHGLELTADLAIDAATRAAELPLSRRGR